MFGLQGYGPLLLKGFWQTVVVGLSSMGVSILWGLLLAGLGSCSCSWIRRSVRLYVNVVRAVPELVALLVLYYGIPSLIQQSFEWLGCDVVINLPPFWAALLALGGIYGAFASEVFRSAFAQVPRGCLDAAHSLALPGRSVFFSIVLPLAASHAIVGLSNVWMTLIKATAITSAIQIPELMYNADLATHATHLPFVFYLTACLLYLAITACSAAAQALLSRWPYTPKGRTEGANRFVT